MNKMGIAPIDLSLNLLVNVGLLLKIIIMHFPIDCLSKLKNFIENTSIL
jgi:hypothetical protein